MALLSDVLDINPQSITRHYPHDTIEYIDISSVHTGSYDGTKTLKLKDAPSRAKRIVADGDTLLATVRPNLRAFLYIKDPVNNAIASTGFAVLRAKPGKLDNRYLYYVVTNQKFTDYLTLNAKGSAYPAVDAGIIGRAEIDLPSLGVQQKIAGILGAYDDLIENNSKRIERLEAMARLLYQNSIKDNFDEAKLSEITGLITRGISPKYDDNGASVAINQRCIRDQKIDFTVARRQSKTIPINKQVRDGDVLINSTGVGTLGRVAQVLGNFSNTTVDSHVSIVRPSDEVNPYFFGAALMSQQEEFERLGTGATGQTELGRDAIGRVVILLPPVDVQEELGSKIQVIRSLIANLQKRNLNLAQVRDLLLPRLMSGEIKV